MWHESIFGKSEFITHLEAQFRWLNLHRQKTLLNNFASMSGFGQHSKRIAALLPSGGGDDGQFEQITLDFSGMLKATDFETLLTFYENPG